MADREELVQKLQVGVLSADLPWGLGTNDGLPKLPWKMDEWSGVFGSWSLPKPSHLRCPPGGWVDLPSSSSSSSGAAGTFGDKDPFKGLSLSAAKHPDEERSARLEQWRLLAKKIGRACSLGRHLMECITKFDEDDVLLNTMFPSQLILWQDAVPA